MIVAVRSNNFCKGVLANYFCFFMTTIISIIISLIFSRNSILDSEIASRCFLSLGAIMLENKDLRDIGELDMKVVKFV